MKKTYAIIISIAIIAVGAFIFLDLLPAYKERTASFTVISATMTPATSTLKLTSSAFAEGGMIPAVYSCTGGNINPPLSIAGVPPVAQSLVLILEDPDAPVGIWDHWVVFNIDPKTIAIAEGKEPDGTAGMGSSGKVTYQGPCPPSGTHRYIFTVYALNTMLALPNGASKNEVVHAMNGHVIGEGQLTGRYSK